MDMDGGDGIIIIVRERPIIILHTSFLRECMFAFKITERDDDCKMCNFDAQPQVHLPSDPKRVASYIQYSTRSSKASTHTPSQFW